MSIYTCAFIVILFTSFPWKLFVPYPPTTELGVCITCTLLYILYSHIYIIKYAGKKKKYTETEIVSTAFMYIRKLGTIRNKTGLFWMSNVHTYGKTWLNKIARVLRDITESLLWNPICLWIKIVCCLYVFYWHACAVALHLTLFETFIWQTFIS